MNRDNVIQSLRELADLLEARPEFPIPSQLEQDPVSLAHWIWSKNELFELARKLGSFKKRYTDDRFELVVTLPSGEDAERILIQISGQADSNQ